MKSKTNTNKYKETFDKDIWGGRCAATNVELVNLVSFKARIIRCTKIDVNA